MYYPTTKTTGRIKYSRVTTEPLVEPVTVCEAKKQCKVEGNEEDDLINFYITVAREFVEDTTNRSLITQTREIKLDKFPCGRTIELTHGRLQTVTSIEYYDEDDVIQTFAAVNYWVDEHSDVPCIKLKDSADWPSTSERQNAVIIEYVAGYGDAPSDVPAKLRQAINMLCAYMVAHRGDEKGYDIPEFIMNMIRPFVITQTVWQ